VKFVDILRVSPLIHPRQFYVYSSALCSHTPVIYISLTKQQTRLMTTKINEFRKEVIIPKLLFSYRIQESGSCREVSRPI